jgi:CRISPR-associated exonuclease Cas4
MVVKSEAVSIYLRVSDVKQFLYCPRVVYYTYLMPVTKRPTTKMAQGKVEELNLDRLETRRKLRRYGLAEGKRLFHQHLSSPRLMLSGKLDLLIVCDNHYYPVDIKFTSGRPRRNHIFQVAAYALLVEENYQTEVENGFLYLTPSAQIVKIETNPSLKEEVIGLLSEIRRMLAGERMPEIPASRGKCVDCEYQNYCGDVW